MSNERQPQRKQSIQREIFDAYNDGFRTYRSAWFNPEETRDKLIANRRARRNLTTFLATAMVLPGITVALLKTLKDQEVEEPSQQFIEKQYKGFYTAYDTIASAVEETSLAKAFTIASNIPVQDGLHMRSAENTIILQPALRSVRLRAQYLQARENLTQNIHDPKLANDTHDITTLALLFGYMGSYAELSLRGTQNFQKDISTFSKADTLFNLLQKKQPVLGSFITEVATVYTTVSGEHITPQLP